MMPVYLILYCMKVHEKREDSCSSESGVVQHLHKRTVVLSNFDKSLRGPTTSPTRLNCQLVLLRWFLGDATCHVAVCLECCTTKVSLHAVARDSGDVVRNEGLTADVAFLNARQTGRMQSRQNFEISVEQNDRLAWLRESISRHVLYIQYCT